MTGDLDLITVRRGPAIILDHQEPHFDAGICFCSCPACARNITGVVSGVIHQVCVCPDCPCESSQLARSAAVSGG